MARQPAVPPFPALGSRILELIVDMTMQYLEDGEVDVRGAVRYASLHGWLEGHLEGEACAADCLHNLRWQTSDPDGPDSN